MESYCLIGAILVYKMQSVVVMREATPNCTVSVATITNSMSCTF